MLNTTVRRVAMTGSRLITLPIRVVSLPTSPAALIHTTSTLNAVAKTTTKKPATKKPVPKKPAPKNTTTIKKTTVSKATTKKAASKKAALKKAIKKKAPVKKTVSKKVLTDRQKGILARQKKRDEINELEEIALVKNEPKPLPSRPYNLFIAEWYKQNKSTGSVTIRIKEIAAAYKSLPTDQLEALKKRAANNHATNTRTLESFIESRSPVTIWNANAARRSLLRKQVSGFRNISQLYDPRVPPRPATGFIKFFMEIRHKPVVEGLALAEMAKKIGAEWKALGESGQARYNEEYRRKAADWKARLAELGITIPGSDA